MRFDHIRLLVGDVPASLAFYRDLMRMQVTFDDGGNYAVLESEGGLSLHLFRRDLMADAVGQSAPPSPGGTQDPVALIFEVDAFDATAKRLRDQGATLVTEPIDREEWGIRAFHLRDPDGNLVEVNEPLKPA